MKNISVIGLLLVAILSASMVHSQNEIVLTTEEFGNIKIDDFTINSIIATEGTRSNLSHLLQGKVTFQESEDPDHNWISAKYIVRGKDFGISFSETSDNHLELTDIIIVNPSKAAVSIKNITVRIGDCIDKLVSHYKTESNDPDRDNSISYSTGKNDVYFVILYDPNTQKITGFRYLSLI